MSVLGWVITIVIFICGAALLFVAWGKNYDAANLGIFGVSLTAISTLIICTNLGWIGNSPKAIDVYRGKTTLEITYKDSVPVDSTVVWKSEK